MTKMGHECRDLRKMLQAYVDGALSVEDRATVEGHLPRCPSCAEEFRRAQTVVGLISSAVVKERELPPFFVERLKAHLREETVHPRPALAPYRLAWAAAFVVIVALGVTLVVRQAGRQGRIGGPGQVVQISPAPERPVQPEEAAPAPSQPVTTASATISTGKPSAEIVYPEEDGLLKNGEIDIAAAFYPPNQDAKVSLLLDDRDVTDLAEITSDYVLFSSPWDLESGYHLLTLRVTDAKGGEQEHQRLFYVL